MFFNVERVKNFGVPTLGSKEKIWVDIVVEWDAKHIARKQVKTLRLKSDPALLFYYFFVLFFWVFTLLFLGIVNCTDIFLILNVN